MGEVIQLFEFEDVDMAGWQVSRWESLVNEVGVRALSARAGQNTLTPNLANIIGRMLLRLRNDSKGHIALDQLEDELYGISPSSIRRASRIAQSLGFLRVDQKRRGATWRLQFIESGFDRLEVKVRMDVECGIRPRNAP